MADRWFLRNQQGQVYELNSTFSAEQYEPGSVDTNSLSRREGYRLYQRSGDGLRTPGPLRLNGRVWRDDRDLLAMWAELEAIEAAVQSCATVERRTSRSLSRYNDLAGGPTAAIHPDGVGGYTVDIELWPGRAEPTIIPTLSMNTRIYVWVDTSGSVNEPAIRAAIDQLKVRLQQDVYMDTPVDSRVFYDASWTNERWVTKLTETAAAAEHTIAMIFINESDPVYHAGDFPSPEPTAQYVADYTAFIQQVAQVSMFSALVYAVTLEAPSYQVFKAHLASATSGALGYPTGLSQFGLQVRLDANPTQSADQLYRDLWRLIG